MNELQVFNHAEFGELETILIDGKLYFPATRCAEMLGYSNPHKAIQDHCPHLTKREVGVQTGYRADGTPATQIVTPAKDGELHSSIHTYWTQRGRLFLHDLLRNDGILPLMEREAA